MATYGKIFHKGSVVWEIESTTKFDAIRQIVSQSPVFQAVEGLNLDEFADEVISREKVQSTAFGHGVAVTHGRSDCVGRSLVALGVSRKGIDFDAPDGEPVHLVFVVANHPDQPMDYLTILSTLVALLRNPDFRAELLQCVCQHEIETKLSYAFRQRLASRSARPA